MADCFHNDGKKCDKNKYYSCSSRKKGTCFVKTHTIAGSGENLTGNIPLLIFVPSNTSRTVFEDFTENHNKTLIQISVASGSSPLDVTIRTRGSRIPITARLLGSSTRIFQVEDFESLIFSNTSNDSGIADIFIQKTFCICCHEQNDSCDKHDCND